MAKVINTFFRKMYNKRSPLNIIADKTILTQNTPRDSTGCISKEDIREYPTDGFSLEFLSQKINNKEAFGLIKL